MFPNLRNINPQTNTVPNLRGTQRGGGIQTPVASPVQETPAPLDFMQVGKTKEGTPYYSSGSGALSSFQGWARRTFARLTNPKFYTPKPTAEQTKLQSSWETGYEKTLKSINWDEWGGKVLGITSKELSTGLAGLKTGQTNKLAKTTVGETISEASRFGYQLGMEVVNQGFDLLQGGDWLVRKAVIAPLNTIEQLADRLNSTKIPDTHGAFQGAWSYTRDAFKIITALSSGKMNFVDVKSVYNQNQLASSAAYSLLWDSQVQAEWQRRFVAGEDPRKLNLELQNPWAELVGSILGDPLTYLGLTLPMKGGRLLGIGAKAEDLGAARTIGKLPFLESLGEKIGGSVGETLKNLAVRKTYWTMEKVLPDLGDILHIGGRTRIVGEVENGWARISDDVDRAIINLGKSEDGARTLQNTEDLVKVSGQSLSKFISDYSITAKTSSGKARIIDNVLGDIFRIIHADGTDIDGGATIIRAMVDTGNADENIRKAAWIALNKTPFGTLFHSDNGHLAIHIAQQLDKSIPINRLLDGFLNYKKSLTAKAVGAVLDDDTLKSAKWFIDEMKVEKGEEVITFGDKILKELSKVTHDLIPSVNDMYDATKIPEAERTAKQLVLAEKYKDVPLFVRETNHLAEALNKIYKPIQGFLSTVWLSYGSPGYPIRNIATQTMNLIPDLGVGPAVEVGKLAAVNMWVEKSTNAQLLIMDDITRNIVGTTFKNEGTVGIMGGAATMPKSKAFALVNYRGDMIMGKGVELYVLQTELQKVLRQGGAIPPASILLDGGFSEAEVSVVLKSILDNWGMSNKVEKDLRALSGGFVEPMRGIDMNKNLRETLQRFAYKDADGNATGRTLWDRYNEVQRTSQNPDELQEITDQIKHQLDANSIKASMGAAGVSRDAPEEVVDAVHDIQQMEGAEFSWLAPEEYTRMVNQRENLKDDMTLVVTNMRNKLVDVPGVDTVGINNKLAELDIKYGHTQASARKMGNIRKDLYEGLASGKYSKREVWTKAAFPAAGWSLSKDFPTVNPDTIKASELKKMLWQSWEEADSKMWAQGVQAKFQESTEFLTETGAKLGLKDITTPFPGQDDIYARVLVGNKQYEQTVLDYRKFRDMSGNFPMNADLSHLDFSTSWGNEYLEDNSLRKTPWTPDGRRKTVFNWVNWDRVHNPVPVEPAQSLSEITAYEASFAIRRRTAKMAVEDTARIAAEYRFKVTRVAGLDYDEAIAKATSEMPPELQQTIRDGAKTILDELSGLQAGVSGGTADQVGDIVMAPTQSMFPNWYGEMTNDNVNVYGVKTNAEALFARLQEIIDGTDKPTAVSKRVKSIILDRIFTGDEKLGIPPDIKSMILLKANKKDLDNAVAIYENIYGTKIDVRNIEESLKTIEVPQHPLSPEITRLVNTPPVYTKGTQPNMAVAYAEGYDGFVKDLQAHTDNLLSRWGEKIKTPGTFTDEKEKAWQNFRGILDERMTVARVKTMDFAKRMRDFALLDYEKTYGDVALAYLLPYQYWSTHTYKNWMERIAQNPAVMTAYVKYKRFMDAENADLPDWWKYNIPVTFLPGTSKEHPLFFNLEASINPLYGITGVDFSDANKRVDWMSETVDDLGKFGPTPFAPIQWLLAANLVRNGEIDAAKRWVGRLIPGSQMAKALLTVSGATKEIQKVIPEGTPLLGGLRYGELDPVVGILDGGLDPYEERRVTRAMSWLIQNGSVDPAAAIDAVRTHSGPLWDMAVYEAIDNRAVGQVLSYLGGMGFKARTPEDMKVDEFYADYGQLITMRPMMSTVEYRSAMAKMQETYPFMDTVLIGSKKSDDRDSSYAYNVLARMPPGKMSDLLETVGINNKMVNAFYEGKGEFTSFTPQDRERFMVGMVDMGAMLAIPGDADRRQWNDAKNTYDQMRTQLAQQFGNTIQDKIDAYFDLGDSDRKAYLEMRPEVAQALDAQQSYIVNTPILYRFYGGIRTLEMYYTSSMYAQLEEKFGQDIQQKWNIYYDKQLEDAANGTKTANPYYKSHPELAAYSKLKSQLSQSIPKAVLSFSQYLPEAQVTNIREDFAPQGTTQEAMLSATQTQQMRWEDWQKVLSESMQRLLLAYFTENKALPSVALNQLEYDAEPFGMTAQEALVSIGQSLRQ